MGFWKRIFSRSTSAESDISAAKRPFYFRGNTLVNEDSSMQVAAFNRGIIYISSQIAKLPWDVKDATNNIIQGPISNLLNLAPNKEMNAFRFRLFMIQQAIINGNSYAEIERNNVGTPIALWPLVSCQMELVRAQNGDLVYKYSGGDAESVYLQPKDVFHLPNFHTKDGLVGQGIVAYGKEVLGIQLAADNMASGIFHNSGIPSGILKHPGRLSDEAYDRLKKSWAEQSGGKKSGSTSILEEGITYESVNVEPEALQFLQSRQFGVLEIARFLGVPPTKLFDVTAATYSNVENSNLEVATDTLDSWATNLEMEADVKILNYRYGGRFTDIDLYAIFRGDMQTRSAYFKSMIGIGAMTPNQIRAREGLSPYPEGDDYYIATNNLTPVDMIQDLIEADITQKTKPAPTPAAKPKEEIETSSDLAKAAITYLMKK
jgi:HK97 family phage portal protein